MLSFSQCRFAINHCLNELFGEFSSSSCSTFTDKRSHKSEKGLLFLYSLVFIFFWVSFDDDNEEDKMFVLIL